MPANWRAALPSHPSRARGALPGGLSDYESFLYPHYLVFPVRTAHRVTRRIALWSRASSDEHGIADAAPTHRGLGVRHPRNASNSCNGAEPNTSVVCINTACDEPLLSFSYSRLHEIHPGTSRVRESCRFAPTELSRTNHAFLALSMVFAPAIARHRIDQGLSIELPPPWSRK